MGKHRSVARRIIDGVLGGGGFTITNIIVNVVLIRLVLDCLPRDVSGIWFLFISIGLYVAFFDLGISPTISREIGFVLGSSTTSESEKARGVADIIATGVRVFQVSAAVVFWIALLGGGAFVLSLAPVGAEREIAIAWGVFSLGASVNILGGAAYATLYGLGHVATERIVRAAGLWLWLALSALFLYLDFGIIGLSAAWVTQNLLARGIGWLLIYRYNPELRDSGGRASMEIFKAMAMPSIKWAAIGLGALLILQADNPIIALVMGPEAIPPYEAALKMILAMMTFSLLVVTSSTPYVSRAWGAGQMNVVREILLRNVRYGVSAMVVLVAYLGVFGDAVVSLWLGPGNFVGYPVLWTLLAMLTLEVHHIVHASTVMGAGHIVFLRASLLAGAMKVALSLVLARYYGLLGVALGTFIAQLLTNNWYAPYVSLRMFEIRFSRYLIKYLAPMAVLLCAMLSMNYWLLGRVAGDGPLWVIVRSFPLSMAVGGCLVMFVVLDRAERGRIAALVPGLRRRKKGKGE